MNFNDIFEAYYNLYRAEADTPDTTDDEYTIAMRYANEAIRRWGNYDGTYWKELYNTLVGASTGDKTIVAGTKEYACPDDMKEVGGLIMIIDADGNVVRNYRIYEAYETQFMGDSVQYCYFTGDESNGFTLHFNVAPGTSLDGLEINYIYYKKPVLFTTGNAATAKAEMSDPMFIVHRMLAQRFRASRNPYYNSALRDSEDSLRMMKLRNDSGSWANPWVVPDRSSTVWGA